MSAPSSKPTTSVKLVLLGEAAVGKSSLVLRFVSNDFQENKEPTIGAAFLTQKCTLPNRTIKFEIWDTAGQERFASLAPMYYRNAQSALVVYDVTKPTSFIKARHWVNELKAQANKNIIIALVGNKVDLVSDAGKSPKSKKPSSQDGEELQEPTPEDEIEAAQEEENAKDDGTVTRKVAREEGEALAKSEGLLFFETSAKSGLYVSDVFMSIANKIPEESGAAGAAASGPNGRNGGGRANGARNGGRVDLESSGERGDSQACSC